MPPWGGPVEARFAGGYRQSGGYSAVIQHDRVVLTLGTDAALQRCQIIFITAKS
jgi:hypothetical protein